MFGTADSVIIREVSPIQCVLIREVSPIQSVLYREVPLYLLWQGLSFSLVVFVVLFVLKVPAFDWALFVALETESM